MKDCTKDEVGIAATIATLKTIASGSVHAAGALMSARLCVSPDGRRAVIALHEKRAGFSLVKKYTTRVLLADAVNPGSLREVISVDGCIEEMSFACGENSLWLAETKNSVHVQRWDIETPTLQTELSISLDKPPVQFAFSAKGDLLAVVAKSGRKLRHISIWNLPDGKLRYELKIPGETGRKAAPCP